MKLLSWMHRKSQTNNTDSLKDSAIGSSSTYFLQVSPPNTQGDYDFRPINSPKMKQQSRHQCQHHFKEINAENSDGVNKRESNDIFPGFLTIGTLSVEPITEPKTPTFDSPCQRTNEDGMSEIKYDLKIINEALEKFLIAETELERNNEVSNRDSQAVTATLSDDVKENSGEYSSVKMQEYPLQGYLLGSSTQHLEKKKKAKKEKAPLHKLFQKIRIMDRGSLVKDEETLKQPTKEMKSSTHLVTKKLLMPPTCPRISPASTGCGAESFPTLTKLSKIKQLFHKKIHPEIRKSGKESHKFSSYENKKILEKSISKLSRESNRLGFGGPPIKKENRCSTTEMQLAQDATTTENLNVPQKENSCWTGREHWIKTDAEYFVLEL